MGEEADVVDRHAVDGSAVSEPDREELVRALAYRVERARVLPVVAHRGRGNPRVRSRPVGTQAAIVSSVVNG